MVESHVRKKFFQRIKYLIELTPFNIKVNGKIVVMFDDIASQGVFNSMDVRVYNLKQNNTLNGKIGTIIGFSSKNSRFIVNINEKKYLINYWNLECESINDFIQYDNNDIYEFTSSSLNLPIPFNTEEKGPLRIGSTYRKANFGVVRIFEDKVVMELTSNTGKVVNSLNLEIN